MFDADGSGAISLAEFLHVTSSLQKRLHHISPIRRTGLQTDDGSDPVMLMTTVECVKSIFLGYAQLVQGVFSSMATCPSRSVPLHDAVRRGMVCF